MTTFSLGGNQYFNLIQTAKTGNVKEAQKMWDALPQESKKMYSAKALIACNPQNRAEYDELLQLRKQSKLAGR